MAQISLAIVGATGNVGREVLRLLESAQHDFLKGAPVLLASSVSAGESLPYVEDELTVKAIKDFDFSGVNVALFATGADVTAEYAPKAIAAGVRVVDLSGHFRADESTPLFAEGVDVITPQTEAVTVADTLALQLYPVLKQLEGHQPQRVVSTAMVPVGRAGGEAMDELFSQSAGLLGGAGDEGMHGHAFSAQIAFNVIPHVGTFAGAVTDVEMAPVLELNRLLSSAIPVSTTAVHVPTFVGTSQSVMIDCGQEVHADDVRKLLDASEALTVIDAPEKNEYSTPFGTAETGKVYVSRVRGDALNPNTLYLWLTCDNLRKAATTALSAVEAFAKAR